MNLARDANMAEKNMRGSDNKVYPRSNGISNDFAQDTDFVIEPRFKDDYDYADGVDMTATSA